MTIGDWFVFTIAALSILAAIFYGLIARDVPRAIGFACIAVYNVTTVFFK